MRNHTRRPAARIAAYPNYKAERPPTPADLVRQLALLDQVLEALGAEIAVAPGWEADDAIATLCSAADQGDHIDIVANDLGFLELVRDASPRVRVLSIDQGMSQLRKYDEAAVLAEYGVPPSRYADFAMLQDNQGEELPGVPGGDGGGSTAVAGCVGGNAAT